MNIQLILTFEEDQKIFQRTFVPSILKTKQSFINFCLLGLTKEERNQIVKISSSIDTKGKNIEIPQWFLDDNGKVWFENGKPI